MHMHFDLSNPFNTSMRRKTQSENKHAMNLTTKALSAKKKNGHLILQNTHADASGGASNSFPPGHTQYPSFLAGSWALIDGNK